MWKIYKALREHPDQPGRFTALKEAVLMSWTLRKGCIEGIHVTLDVWDDRCWHERINDKIERLEAKRVWGNPEIVWAPRQPYELDEVEFREPVSSGVDYHPWRQ